MTGLVGYLPQISLVVLVVVIALGFIKKVNIGFLSIGATFLLTMFAIALKFKVPAAGGAMKALKVSAIAGGFSSSMFVTLVGVTFLFGMASQNGTLDLVSKKVVSFVVNKTVLIHPLMFFLSAFVSA